MRSFVVWPILLVAACGGRSERPLASRCGPGRDLGEAEALLHRALCERATGCGHFTDPESCLRVTFDADRLLEEGESGCVRYFPERMDACTARLSEAACTWTDLVGTLLGECTAPFEGTLGPGEPCASDLECESRACLGAPCGEACCTKVCAARDAPVGSACRYHEDCVEEAFCDEGACAPLRPAGTPCTADGAVTCEDSLWCIAGICTVPPGEGEPCGASAFFFSCDDQRDQCDDETRKCVRTVAVGAPCSDDGARCIAQTTCKDGHCVPLPSAGEPCEDGLCLGDLLCGTSGRCEEPEPAEPAQPAEPAVRVCAP